MNIRMMNFKKYYESFELVGEPVDVKQLPKFKIDFPAISKYARSVGKAISDLTPDELDQFIEGGYQKLVEYIKETKNGD